MVQNHMRAYISLCGVLRCCDQLTESKSYLFPIEVERKGFIEGTGSSSCNVEFAVLEDHGVGLMRCTGLRRWPVVIIEIALQHALGQFQKRKLVILEPFPLLGSDRKIS